MLRICRSLHTILQQLCIFSQQYSCIGCDKSAAKGHLLNSYKGYINMCNQNIDTCAKSYAENCAAPRRPAYDVIVIGGGMLGAFTARELSQYRLKVLVIEQAYDVGEGSTKANSGILYPGFHPRGGSLKGKSCATGNAMYDALCARLGVRMKRTGALFVAFNDEGEKKLRDKYENGVANGVPGMEIISGDAARGLEPALSQKVTKALYAPTAAVISPFDLIVAVSESAEENGVEFLFGAEVTDIRTVGGIVEVEAGGAVYTADFAVNAAGENAARIEGRLMPQDLIIKPKRGQYYVFDKQSGGLLRHIIFQAQESDEGGALLAPTVDGNLIAGPTSENVASYRNTETTAKGLERVERVAKKLIPALDMGKVITSFAGVRVNISNVEKEFKDFVIRESGPRVVSALGIKNPGMTASPYLAELIVKMLGRQGLDLIVDPEFRPELKRRLPFLKETPEKQKELYESDNRYARIVCRCEEITEGDVLAALRSPLPPKSLGGLKKRLRIGMGRCQGGFCTARVIEIMSRETGRPPDEILKGEKGSNLIKGWVK